MFDQKTQCLCDRTVNYMYIDIYICILLVFFSDCIVWISSQWQTLFFFLNMRLSNWLILWSLPVELFKSINSHSFLISLLLFFDACLLLSMLFIMNWKLAFSVSTSFSSCFLHFPLISFAFFFFLFRWFDYVISRVLCSVIDKNTLACGSASFFRFAM